MGIDLKAGGRRTGHKSSMKVVKTKNPYNRLLIKLYKFLSRRTDSKFCETVLKRLHMSKVNQPPIGLHRLSKYMSKKEGKTAVIVGKVTDDVRNMNRAGSISNLKVHLGRHCDIQVNETRQIR